ENEPLNLNTLKSTTLQSKLKQHTLQKLTSLIIFLVALLFRSFNIHSSPFVLWDEAHFGKFASRYLNREFYFDVHPPLGKMLTALIGYISKMDKSFQFISGNEYPTDFYIMMRYCHSIIGSLCISLVYLSMINFSINNKIAITISLMLIIENGLITISRLILLDSTLLFFTFLTVYAYSLYKLKNESNNFFNLIFLGTCLGCTISVKWIGVFLFLLIGIHIIIEIFYNLINKDFKFIIIHFIKRFMTLIILPICLYFFFFIIHFKITNKRSSDEGHMSSRFVHTMLLPLNGLE
ncbi:dolichyl-phosphate-mannose-protein mannosyltransferase, partial [Pseudoloma neurophilia]